MGPLIRLISRRMGGLCGVLNKRAREMPAKPQNSDVIAKSPWHGHIKAIVCALFRAKFTGFKRHIERPMPSTRLLVIEGNSPQTLAEHIAVGGTAAHQGYSNLLR